jgi:hypothetical protein
MDLDEPADVHWSEAAPSTVVDASNKKSCETVAEAVRFVMETLAEPFRPSAWIASSEKHLGYPEIQTIYESAEYKAFAG